MGVFIGTSGFGYSEWAGKFYPKGLPADERLAYYAERFNATEINNTFYALPKPALIKAWLAKAPPGFSLSYKAPGRVTHMKRLKNAGPELKRFLKVIGPDYGVVVFQLPPNFKKDLPRLKAFLELLPEGGRFAFEFRNPTWFDAEVLALLKRRKLALVHNDADVKGCPVVMAPFGVLKLRRARYTARELASWAKRIRSSASDTFVFFKHEETASGPRFAAALARLVPDPARRQEPAAFDRPLSHDLSRAPPRRGHDDQVAQEGFEYGSERSHLGIDFSPLDQGQVLLGHARALRQLGLGHAQRRAQRQDPLAMAQSRRRGPFGENLIESPSMGEGKLYLYRHRVFLT